MKNILTIIICAVGLHLSAQIISGVNIEAANKCDTSVYITFSGIYPSTNYRISNIEMYPSSGGDLFTPVKHYCDVYVESEGVGLTVLTPFQFTIGATPSQIGWTDGWSSDSIIVRTIIGNLAYNEKSYPYEARRPAVCMSVSPEEITTCDSIEVVSTHIYSSCNGYQKVREDVITVLEDTILITSEYVLPENALICFNLGPNLTTDRNMIAPLSEGDYVIKTAVWVEMEGVMTLVPIKPHCVEEKITVKQGECPITDLKGKNTIQSMFYPSPVQSQLMVSEEVYLSRIYSLSGQLLLETKDQIIDVKGLPEGAYIIEMKAGNNFVKEKFIKE